MLIPFLCPELDEKNDNFTCLQIVLLERTSDSLKGETACLTLS